MSRAVRPLPKRGCVPNLPAGFLHLVVGLIEVKKEGAALPGSLGRYLFCLRLEAVGHPEAHGAWELVGERLPVPSALRYRTNSTVVSVDPCLHVVPALKCFVRRRISEGISRAQ